MRRRALLWTALIALAAALALWLQGLREPQRHTAVPGPADRPDSTFTDARLVVMDAAGAPHYRLRTPRMAHYPANAGTRLKRPRVAMLRRDRPPVHLRAARGWIIPQHQDRAADEDEEIRLRGNVHLVRKAGPLRPRVSVRTSRARVWPSRETAASDRSVTIVSDANRVAGVGMRFDLLHDTVHILARARGTYAP